MEYRATIGFRAACRLNLTIVNMARDFHDLRFQLEHVESLIENNMLESARAEIDQLFQFYEEAELDGVPIGFTSAIMGKAKNLRTYLNIRLAKNKKIRSDLNIRPSKTFVQKWCSIVSTFFKPIRKN